MLCTATNAKPPEKALGGCIWPTSLWLVISTFFLVTFLLKCSKHAQINKAIKNFVLKYKISIVFWFLILSVTSKKFFLELKLTFKNEMAFLKIMKAI